MKPTWHLAMSVFSRSMKGEMGSPLLLSVSPCAGGTHREAARGRARAGRASGAGLGRGRREVVARSSRRERRAQPSDRRC